MRLLDPIKSVEESNEVLEGKWKKKELVMGFGHRIYKKEDPRSDIIKECSIQMSKQPYGRPTLVEVSKNIESRMINEKKIYPNLDFYAASSYHQCGIHTYFFNLSLETSLPQFSSFRELQDGPLILLNKGRLKSLSDLSLSILAPILCPSLRFLKGLHCEFDLFVL